MSDTISAALWFLIHAVQLGVFRKFVRTLSPLDRPWQHVAPTMVFLWTSTVVGTFVASLFHVISFAGLLTWSVLSVLIVATVNKRQLSTRDLSSSTSRQPKSVPEVAIWLVISLITAKVLHTTVTTFPQDWDTLMYHLPLINEWIRSQSLYGPGCPVWYNSANFEILGLWMAIPFSGDFWVRTVSLIPAVLLFCSTCEITLQLKVPPALSVAVAALVVATPIVGMQLGTMKNDIAVVALFATGLAFGLRWIRHGAAVNLLTSAAAIGLLAGTKYYALGYAAVAILVLILMHWSTGQRDKCRDWILACGGMLILCSGFWYARNMTITGSPLYPLGIAQADSRLAELRPNTFQSTLLGNGDPMLAWQFVDHVRDMGGAVQSYLLLFLAPIVLIPVAFRCYGTRPNWTFVPALIVGSAIVLLVTPFLIDPDDAGRLINSRRTVRFAMCLLWAVTIGAADGLCRIADTQRNRRSTLLAQLPKHVVCAAFVIQAAMCFFGWLQNAFLLLSVLTADVFILAVFASRVNRNAWFGRGAVVVLAIVFSVATSQLHRHWSEQFSAHYDKTFRTRTFTFLENNAPPETRIAACVGRCYPCYGSARQFVVLRPESIFSTEEYRDMMNWKPDYLVLQNRENETYGRYRNRDQWKHLVSERFVELDHGTFASTYRAKK